MSTPQEANKIIAPSVIKTNFAGSCLDLNIDQNLAEYGTFLQSVLAALEGMGSAGSEAILAAETIYQAATDGSDQLRYVVGPDAEQIIAARKQMDDPEYLAMIKGQFGL